MPARKKTAAFNPVPQYGTYAPDYRRGYRQEQRDRADAHHAAWEAKPEAEKERRRQEWADYKADMAEWSKIFEREGFEAASAWLSARRPMGNTLGQQRALTKIVDTEARIAVEGDTAINDVPFEESGE